MRRQRENGKREQQRSLARKSFPALRRPRQDYGNRFRLIFKRFSEKCSDDAVNSTIGSRMIDIVSTLFFNILFPFLPAEQHRIVSTE